MKAPKVVLSLIGLLAGSLLLAADTPRKGTRAAPPAEAAFASPLNVWNDVPGETVEPPTPAKCLRLAQRLVKKYDRDGKGSLPAKQWPARLGNLADIDANHDGVVTVDELAKYLARYARLHPLRSPETAWQHLPQPPADLFRPVTPAEDAHKTPATGSNGQPPNDQPMPSPNAPGHEATSADDKKAGKAQGPARRAADATKKFYVSPSAFPPGLPDWFHQLDTDGDGQLTLGEFAPDGSAARRRLFRRYDQNGDGVITPDEVLRFNQGAGETKAAAPPAGGPKK